MDDTFERRVSDAAVAGWWTWLIAAGFLTLQWIIYLLVMSARPAWILSLWGVDGGWQTVQSIWFWAIAVFKFCLWLMAVMVLWLTLWAKRLRKHSVGA